MAASVTFNMHDQATVAGNCIGGNIDLTPLMTKFQATIPVRDKKKGFFSGKDVVEWLLNNGGVSDREQALTLGLRLEGFGALHHINDEMELKDSDDMYEVPKKIKKPEKKVTMAKKKIKLLTPYLVFLIASNAAIEQLFLNNNEISILPVSLFNNMRYDLNRRLKVLNISSNQITSLPEELGTLVNLVELNAANNQITTLPPEISQLRNLELLDLSNNKIPEIPSEFAELTSLKKIYLTQNKLGKLPTSMGKLTGIKVLHVFENPITDPPPPILLEGSASILAYLRKKAESDKLKEEMRAKLGPSQSSISGEKKKKDMARELDRILFDPKGREAFKSFLKTEFSEENLMFWEEVENFRKIDPKDVDRVEEESERIFNKYISKESQLEINIPATIKAGLQKKFVEVSWEDFGTGSINNEVFTQAQASILKTLKADSLPRFMASDIYKTYKTHRILGASDAIAAASSKSKS